MYAGICRHRGEISRQGDIDLSWKIRTLYNWPVAKGRVLLRVGSSVEYLGTSHNLQNALTPRPPVRIHVGPCPVTAARAPAWLASWKCPNQNYDRPSGRLPGSLGWVGQPRLPRCARGRGEGRGRQWSRSREHINASNQEQIQCCSSLKSANRWRAGGARRSIRVLSMSSVSRLAPAFTLSAWHGILPQGQASRPPRGAGRHSRRKAGSFPYRPRCRAYAMMPVDVVKTGPLGTPPSRSPAWLGLRP